MNPQDHPDIVDALAAEYVLGTLRGRARRRFESWRSRSPAVEARCRFWEDNLMSLAKGLRPIRPPPQVWQGIRARLGMSRSEPQRRAGRAWAIAAGIVLVTAMSAMLYWRSTELGSLSEVAHIGTAHGAQAWEVDVYRDTGRMVLRVGRTPAIPPGHDFELWALPAGGKPVSLGVLPVSGSKRRTLTGPQLQALVNSTQVAVTVEQPGGSPSGQPTSAPILVAPLTAS
jgi:anti-sigma-K factor RskA